MYWYKYFILSRRRSFIFKNSIEVETGWWGSILKKIVVFRIKFIWTPWTWLGLNPSNLSKNRFKNFYVLPPTFDSREDKKLSLETKSSLKSWSVLPKVTFKYSHFPSKKFKPLKKVFWFTRNLHEIVWYSVCLDYGKFSNILPKNGKIGSLLEIFLIPNPLQKRGCAWVTHFDAKLHLFSLCRAHGRIVW